ncbi:hypothetical protein KZ483_06095 [Paenibacillus sp. sptzw28]|uniref:hypothetical protein n=1 Tax=Paenibacillus sp. sptzw28 TaxID=715179 RepID=UPI001C6EE17F|nr:hypothetical protein [Paenibacillus sp. sptzw28]QYR22538.1 hypothetical protein KZ483_06095 [Paenibacillus sp. sptzw28]
MDITSHPIYDSEIYIRFASNSDTHVVSKDILLEFRYIDERFYFFAAARKTISSLDTSSIIASFSKALYFPIDMKKAPLTAAGFIISPVYRKGSISESP